jgi:hypothetical protein
VAEYVRRFRDTRNKCYSLIIGERDLAELVFAGLMLSIRDKMEGHDFSNMNHVLQHVMAHENHAKVIKIYGQFKEMSSKDKPVVNCVGDELVSDDEDGLCVAVRVNTTKDQPLVCAVLKPSPEGKDEMKYTFDLSNCDKLSDVLLQNKIIHLSKGHVVPPAGQPVKGKYCKWHGKFSHTTNECYYFRQQVQSALNDGRLMLGDGHKMRLDVDPFPVNVNMINFKENQVQVRTSQADMTKGKRVIVSDEPKLRMVTPKNPEPRKWKIIQGW